MAYSYLMIDLKTGDVKFQSTTISEFSDKAQELEMKDYKFDKALAHSRLQYLIKKGILPKAANLNCLYCGKSAKHWHHPLGYIDYLAFAVIPVCVHCHRSLENVHTVLRPKIRLDIENESLPLSKIEVSCLDEALRKAKNNKSKAAQILGITRRKLYSRLKILGMEDKIKQK